MEAIQIKEIAQPPVKQDKRRSELPAREEEPTEENPKGRTSKEVTKFDF